MRSFACGSVVGMTESEACQTVARLAPEKVANCELSGRLTLLRVWKVISTKNGALVNIFIVRNLSSMREVGA